MRAPRSLATAYHPPAWTHYTQGTSTTVGGGSEQRQEGTCLTLSLCAPHHHQISGTSWFLQRGRAHRPGNTVFTVSPAMSCSHHSQWNVPGTCASPQTTQSWFSTGIPHILDLLPDLVSSFYKEEPMLWLSLQNPCWSRCLCDGTE